MVDNPQLRFQYILQEYKNEQNRLKSIKQELKLQCERFQQRISKQLSKIEEVSLYINSGAQIQTNIYTGSLENYSPSVIDLGTLSNYLKRQKNYLSQIIANEQEVRSVPKSGTQLLHKVANKKKMQKYLQHLECLKIQKEIQYLQNNIFIGLNSKGKPKNILYEDIESVPNKEKQQQTAQIKYALEQLERLVSLSNECGTNIQKERPKKFTQLHQQLERLSTIEQLIDSQTKEIVQVKDFFKDYQPKQITEFFETWKKRGAQTTESAQNNLSLEHLQTSQNISKAEIQFLLSFQCPTRNTTFFKKPFQEVNDVIKNCRNLLKKVKN